MWIKIKQFREYRAQKKLVKHYEREVSRLKTEMQNAYSKIIRVHRCDNPCVAPTQWGTKEQPCVAVHEKNVDLDPFVLDYNIAYAGPRYVFRCPFYQSQEPCDFSCVHSYKNREYFEAQSQYAKKFKIYDKNVARLYELRAKLWGNKK